MAGLFKARELVRGCGRFSRYLGAEGSGTVPLVALRSEVALSNWTAGQSSGTRAWLKAQGHAKHAAGRLTLVPRLADGPVADSSAADADGGVDTAVLSLGSGGAAGGGAEVLEAFGALPRRMVPATGHTIQLDSRSGGTEEQLEPHELEAAALGWALGSYTFGKAQLGLGVRKGGDAVSNRLAWPATLDSSVRARVSHAASSTYLVRDLINVPAALLSPAALEEATRAVAAEVAPIAGSADVRVAVGCELLSGDSCFGPGKIFPMVWAVGRAAGTDLGDPFAPRLIELTWAPPPPAAGEELPLVTIVGKGVTFDTGGLDLKPAAGMRHMKKDMGGAAQALGLARMVMLGKLRVRLRLLLPAAENAVGPGAFRPGDVLACRRPGFSVEVGNTDAEGRLLLADALWEATEVEEKGGAGGGSGGARPALVIDCATLTGARTVALGGALPPFFCNDDDVAAVLEREAAAAADPLWRLPLWRPYRSWLASSVADINHISEGGKGAGAITAALFLEEFLAPEGGGEDGEGAKKPSWVHVDFQGWNDSTSGERVKGGEAMGMRALFGLVESVANGELG